MKKSLAYLAVGFIALGLSFSACKKGATIGAVGEKDTNPFPVFDTFAIPNDLYYFWGVFDGHFQKWVHNARSDWDTATRYPGVGQDPNVDPWDTWPYYVDNIYNNVCNDGIWDTCPEYKSDWFYKFETRFIRNEIPEQRIAINFYDCVNFQDTFTSPNFITDITQVLSVGAWPFSNYQRGEWGAEIVYTDDNRDRWSTRSGSGNTNDSYLRVTDFYLNTNVINKVDTTDTFAFFTVEGEFAGRLFKEKDPTQQIAVTNSKFRSRILAQRPLGFND